MSKQQILTTHIENLCNAVPELQGVLLASNDGLPIAHSLSDGADPTRLAAMSAAAANLGTRVTEAISTGPVSEVSIRASEGDLFIYSVGGKAVLAILSPQGGNAGLIHLEARAAAEEIGSLFT
jgi:uncharacterized protein